MHLATIRSQTQSVKALLAEGANANAENKFGNTPLHNAAGCGNAAIVSILIDDDAFVNVQNAKGMTPLHNAAKRGFVKV